MDDTGPHAYDSGQDPAGELAELEAAQQQLWATLREEDDPELRMSLLSQFSENRAAIGHLRAELGADGQGATGAAPFYQVELVGEAEADIGQPLTDTPSVMSPPPQAEPLPGAVFSHEPPAAPDHNGYLPGAADPASFPPPVAPHVDGFEPTDGEEQAPAFIVPRSARSRPPVDPHLERSTEHNPTGYDDDVFEPGPAPEAPLPSVTPAAASVPPPRSPSTTGQRPRVATATPRRTATPAVNAAGGDDQLRSTIGQIPPRALWLAGGVLAVLAVVWLFLLFPFGGGGGDGELVADTGPAGPSATEGDPNDIASALADLGFVGITVDDDGDVIRLTGSVTTEAERAAIMGAARALAPGRAVAGAALVVDGDQAGAATDQVAAAEPSGRAAAMQAELDRVVASTPIIFGNNEAALTALHERILNSVASILLAYPDIPVKVIGFTDGAGSSEGNFELSLLRAEAVRAYLISQGVPETSLNVEAMGEETSTGSAAIGILERRVEFRVAAVPGAALTPGADVLKVAIVAPSARNDLAFTQSMVDAMNVVAAERGNVEVSITDATFVPEEAAAAIRDYAAQDYDLVIAHGSQFGASLVDIATEYPDVAFAWGTASDTFGLPNVYAYDAAAGEGGFVLGAMAAALSQSNVVGVVGPIEVGDAAKYVNGFAAGAATQKPGISVPVTYTGSFSDLTLAAETARAHVDSGADVMTGSAQMVVGAVSTASESNVLWFGTQANQTELAPNLVVASQVYHWEVILREIIGDIDNGVIEGRFFTANLANGGLVIEYNDGYPLAPEIRQRGDELVAGIINGSVAVPE
ncbi:MAG: BMP family ABC transporter substrate-binding protein [Actinomycetota bacterium]